jgi:hypothetical protein
MAGVQIHDAINPKDDQPRLPIQCWRAQSDAHTAPCSLSLLSGTERQSLPSVAHHPAATFQSPMGLAADTHQGVQGGTMARDAMRRLGSGWWGHGDEAESPNQLPTARRVAGTVTLAPWDLGRPLPAPPAGGEEESDRGIGDGAGLAQVEPTIYPLAEAVVSSLPGVSECLDVHSTPTKC